jgi:hypothetical protein
VTCATTPGQVDGGLDTRVAATDDGHALALEERPVAMGTVGHAVVAVLLLTGHADLAPPRAGGQDDGLAAQRGAVGQSDLEQFARDQRDGPLRVHHVHVVLAHMLLQRRRELRAFGLLHGDEVLDRQRVQRLAAEPFGNHGGSDAFARGIDCCRRTGRAAADDQHVVRRARVQLGGITPRGAGVDAAEISSTPMRPWPKTCPLR